VYRVRLLELALPAAQPDAPAHYVKRQENQCKDERDDFKREGGNVHIALIGMTLWDFSQNSARMGQYNAAIPVQLYGS